MGLTNIPDREYRIIQGQLSNYPEIFSMPFTGTAVLHRKSGTLDLFFNAVVENEPTSRPSCYDYLSLKDICNQLGVSYLHFDGSASVVVVTAKVLNPGVLGRCGLKIHPSSAEGTTCGIARIYSPDLSLVGTWSMSDGAPGNYYVINQGEQYTFMILGIRTEV